MEFSNLDPSEDEEGVGLELPSPTPRKSTIREEKSLETLLASKNRRLGEELTRFRVSFHFSGNCYTTMLNQYMTVRFDRSCTLNSRNRSAARRKNSPQPKLSSKSSVSSPNG